MKNYLANRLAPFVVTKIWGGRKLVNMRQLDHKYEGEKVGETWDISYLSEGPSLLDGKPLSAYIDETSLPYLVKTIDTSEELSIQVHPGDEYARKYENSSGKTECWLILAAGEGAGIYLGFNEGVDASSFFTALERGQDVSKLLRFYPVTGGEFFFVPAGTIHAIGKNVTLAEIQQSSGITYRVWDWNRVDDKGQGRELHVNKARDVLNFSPECNTKGFFKYQENLIGESASREVRLINHPQFEVSIRKLARSESVILEEKDGRALSVVLLDGGGLEYKLCGESGQIDRTGGFLFKDLQGATSLELTSRDEAQFIIIR